MSEAAKGLDSALEPNSIGPDYFGYYTREVAELLTPDRDCLIFSSNNPECIGKVKEASEEKDVSKNDYTGNDIISSIGAAPSFCDAVGAGLSDAKKERLKAILRQSVVTLSPEVDEMFDPVINMCRVKSRIRQEKSLSSYVSATCEEDAEKHPQKKTKLCSSSPTVSIPSHASPVSCSPTKKGSRDGDIAVAIPGKGISNGCNKQCATCHKITSSNQKTGSEGPRILCNLCAKQGNESLSNMEQKGLHQGSNVAAAEEQKEVNDDLQIFLDYGGPNVEDKIMKYSDILSNTLGGMQQKVEELLDIVMSTCSPMNLELKRQLQRMIKKLPPKNLDRVVEIICPRNPLEKDSSEEIHVNLEDQDNVTLWRLYFYVKTYEKAKRLLE